MQQDPTLAAVLSAASGWKVTDLARQSGVSKSQVSRILRGKSTPSPETLMALARALGLEVPQLEFDLQSELIAAAEKAIIDQLRQITVDLQRAPDRKDVRGMVGLFLTAERGHATKIYKKVFKLAS